MREKQGVENGRRGETDREDRHDERKKGGEEDPF